MLVALPDDADAADTGAAAGVPIVTVPDGRVLAVFRRADGTLRVTDAVCPHNRGPLAQGWVRDDDATVVCPWHWYRFSLETGACHTTDRYELGVYPVVVVDGRPHADVGEQPPVLSWSERLRAHARDG